MRKTSALEVIQTRCHQEVAHLEPKIKTVKLYSVVYVYSSSIKKPEGEHAAGPVSTQEALSSIKD